MGSTRNAGDAGAVESSAGAHPGDRIRSGFKNFAGEKIIGDTVKLEGLVAVCTGGTADIPVAEEAAKTARIFRLPRGRYYDIGVAGIHRLLSNARRLRGQTA